MPNKTKILLGSILAVAILVAGISIPIMAADSTTPTPPATAPVNRNGDMEKVAQILGISTDTLTSAFKQVQDTMKANAPADMETRIAQILGISKDTLMNAEKQAREEQKSATPTSRDDITTRVAAILNISADTLKNAETQARQAMQDEMKTKTPTAQDDMLNQVAQVLGITKDKLESAMQQAQKETSDENTNNMLTQAVTNGKITQDEATQIQTWLANRPAALDKLGGFPGMGGMIPFGMEGKGMGPCIGGRPDFKGAPNSSSTPFSHTNTPTTSGNQTTN